MKSFKQLAEELKLNEGHDRYPGDDMTKKELQIAINSAKNILEMLDNGGEVMRWQISAIVIASQELASVCTSMRADMEDDEEDFEYDEYDMPWMGEDIMESRESAIEQGVKSFADGKSEIRGVSLSKITSAFSSKKNFGAKTMDELEKELGLPIGVLKGIAKEVNSELKADMGSKSSMSQSQRVGRYLAQKYVK